ncbi:pyrroloquinoline quinone precursor peptide PqqA [Nocardia brasiliensis]
MQTTCETHAPETAKKSWQRPDFTFFDTALEVTAYVNRA